jgi:hypothetical protein
MEAIKLLEVIPSLFLKLNHEVNVIRHLHHGGLVLPHALHDDSLDALIFLIYRGCVVEDGARVAAVASIIAAALLGKERPFLN